jgi:hypothetical protein
MPNKMLQSSIILTSIGIRNICILNCCLVLFVQTIIITIKREWEEIVPSVRSLPRNPFARTRPELHHVLQPALKRAGAMSGLTLSTSLPDQANFREEKE